LDLKIGMASAMHLGSFFPIHHESVSYSLHISPTAKLACPIVLKNEQTASGNLLDIGYSVPVPPLCTELPSMVALGSLSLNY
jgi:hypothetical protein